MLILHSIKHIYGEIFKTKLILRKRKKNILETMIIRMIVCRIPETKTLNATLNYYIS